MLRFARDWVMGEAEGQKMIHAHGFTIANLSSRLTEGGRVMKRKAKTQINRVM
jgi:putative Mg2+ transporter-C (MgtC) family protein